MKKQFIFLSLLVSTLSQAKTFTYALRNTPYKEIGICMSEAKTLAKKIEEQSSVPMSNLSCDWDEYTNTSTIKMDYTAENALNFVSTAPEFYKLFHPGFYNTLNDCQADLASQENIFRAETGLNILTSFCYGDRPYIKFPYAIRIEGVGEAKRAPYHSSVFGDGTAIYPTTQELTAKVKAYLSTKNANLIHINFRTYMPENTIVLFYYAEKELTFDREVFYSISDVKSCQIELNSLEEKLLNSGIKIPMAYCGATYLPASSADLFFYFDAGTLRRKSSFEKFNDYRSCSASKNSLVQKYQAAMGANVLAGICQRDLASSEYRVSFIIKN